jgi:hypothetical protein
VITFTIRDEDEKEIREWMEEVEKQRLASGLDNYAGASGGSTTYIITPTSIGVIVEVEHFGVRKDFSHVEDW